MTQAVTMYPTYLALSSVGRYGSTAFTWSDIVMLLALATAMLLSYILAYWSAVRRRRQYNLSDDSVMTRIRRSCLMANLIVALILGAIAAVVAIVTEHSHAQAVILCVVVIAASMCTAMVGRRRGMRSSPAQLLSVVANELTTTGPHAASLPTGDPIWDEDFIKQGVQRVFMAYQQDWSSLDGQAAQRYLTERCYNHVASMMRASRGAGRRSDRVVRRYLGADIIDVTDLADNERDRFTARVRATVTDRLIDAASGQVLSERDYTLCEDWQFRRHYDTWLLDGIN